MLENKYSIFADIKNFTHKTEKLSVDNITELLSWFDELVKSLATTHELTVVKAIGDAYFLVGDAPQEVYDFSQALLKESQKQDAQQKNTLMTLELRVTICYGAVAKNIILGKQDYFWDSINLCSRMMQIAPKGSILCNKEASTYIDAPWMTHVGMFHFRGIQEEVEVMSVTKLSKKEVNSISRQHTQFEQECDDIIFKTSCVAAILSAQPIPFLENFHLVGVQLYMLMKLSETLWLPISMKESSKIFLEVITPLGLSYIAFQWGAAAIKIILPGIGWYFVAPVSFSVSYSLGKIYMLYFLAQKSWQSLDNDTIQSLYNEYKKQAKKIAKNSKSEIIDTGKKYAQEVKDFTKKKEFLHVQDTTVDQLKKSKK